MKRYIFYSLIQCESKNCKGELEINGDKVAIKPGRNLKVKNDSGKVWNIRAKHKIKRKRKDGHSTSGRNIKIKRKGSERFIIAKNLWLHGICEGIARSENVAPWKCFCE